MKKILIWPDVYLEQGHWLPMVSIAQALNDAGHDARFMGIADCKSVVSNHYKNTELATAANQEIENDESYVVPDTSKLQFYTILEKEYPRGYTQLNQHKSINERWKPDHLQKLIDIGSEDISVTDPLTLFATPVPSAISDLIGDETFVPDLIISGYFASLESLAIHYKTTIPIMVSTTYLRHPQDDPGMRIVQNLLGMGKSISQRLMDMMNPANVGQTIEEFSQPIVDAKELLVCPRCYDFEEYAHNLGDMDNWDGDDAGTVFYTEPAILREVIPVSSDETRITASDIEDIVSSGTSVPRIIFVSAGSQVQDYEDKARNLFQNMIELMELPGMVNYHLVMTVGPKIIKEKWIASAQRRKNVTIGSWVDQQAALKSATAAYIHGGLATVKEAIYFSCDSLAENNEEFPNIGINILPLGKDQMDNSLRVKESRVGIVSHVEAITILGLRDVMLKSCVDRNIVKSRTKMLTEFHDMESGANTSASAEIHNYAAGSRASVQIIEKALGL